MAASTNDKFIKTGASTVTTLSAPGKALSATSITVGSTTNYPTDTGIVFAIRQVDVNGDLVAGTYTEWIGTVTSATTLSLLATPVYGSDQVYPAGSTTQVFIPLSSYAHNRMVDGLAVSLDQDGTLKAGAVDNPAVLATDVVETAKIADANITTAKLATSAVTPEKWTNPYKFYAYRGTSNQTISSATYTTVALNAESFDTNNNFNTSTYKYTPPVNGFYMLTGQLFADQADGAHTIVQIKKNSTTIAEQRVVYPPGANLNRAANASVLAQLTTSDEITLVAYIEDVSTPTVYKDWTFLCGYLVSLT